MDTNNSFNKVCVLYITAYIINSNNFTFIFFTHVLSFLFIFTLFCSRLIFSFFNDLLISKSFIMFMYSIRHVSYYLIDLLINLNDLRSEEIFTMYGDSVVTILLFFSILINTSSNQTGCFLVSVAFTLLVISSKISLLSSIGISFYYF